jgi:short-subunit dehydrogenase
MKTTTKPLALVTGASTGIGYELARQFAEHGYDLVIAADEAHITQAGSELRATGASVDSVQVDLATYDGVERLYSTVRAHGTPDVVVINAGVGVGGDFTGQTDLRQELRLIDLNVKSTVHLAKLAARDMAARGSGKILITSSVASTMPAPYDAVYAASKAFDASFAEGLRDELKDKGVTVTALVPGAELGQAGKDDPAEVAKDGYEALMADKDMVIPRSR